MYRSPEGWTGPVAALYRSFDTSEGLSLMAGLVHSNFDPIITGKVNTAISLTHFGTNAKYNFLII